ncbi:MULTISPECIES: ATP-binding protein [unclassified Pseudomonas]|uniref:ATP-binding protein n=1 Tax=unclassified Pseudomonas TaxID=196821 RepID=UPI0010F4A4D0|nr:MULTISPECIES: ATP-binding protein [unclassified Pseudomonas]WJN59495.1 Alginate biosynthesis two-component system sensor histidine kinase KinB [Pseudomonas sp. SO81]
MKLRNQLFLSISALITLALLGLLLGMLSVLMLARAQSESMDRNLQMLEAGLVLRQELGAQLVLILRDKLDRQALEDSSRRFRQALTNAGESALDDADRQALQEIERTYANFEKRLHDPQEVRNRLFADDSFLLVLEAVRSRLMATQARYVEAVELTQEESRQHAWMITALLGLIGVALLLIGFITAHSIARRFGRPIEALTEAADQIGLGNFQVTLPITREVELASLTRRFGFMAEALSQFRASNVAALLAGQRRLQAVLDGIDDGLLILDREGHLEHGNPVAQNQLGWEELPLGQHLSQLLPQPALQAQLEQALEGHHPSRHGEDLQIGERLFSYSLTPVSDDSGAIIAAVMVLHDVTRLRAFERVRSEFVLRASHELRTPVTGMHMAFELLRERLHFQPDSREEDLLHTVGEEMHRLLRLIDDLLNFSRYQSGLQKLELQPCNPAELLEKAARRFAHKAEEQQVELRVEPAEDLPQLQLDCMQLDRVLDNLIGNALRHCHPGGLIVLQARCQGDRLFISVEDDGEGIPQSQQARIFEPFVQVGRRKGGAGLGLALCQEIVQLHGGRIGVKSQPGQGARFYMALPY